ncbi:acyl-CoA thioesterase [Thermocoleostomius sinensis]|jgi:acyl-CoA thioester hydrolase|uniref:Thioesterase family protein n=1 Tax=Thermocoleostomius sinensis A174 TaxID=2016057 RepID=A0A9E8ZAU3_9CYAN|nr:thioesterase family protein [Thermocoleostomius sinensis]WAL59800.1 thioesterase family protein [Thermocoleostomius sinensis A174]
MQPFTIRIHVQSNDIDVLGHVNNSVYQQYLERAAIAHSESLGLTLERYRELGGVFVMRRIEIEYLRPSVVGDVLNITTWVAELRGACTTRRYEIRKPNERNLVLTADALWVWVDAQTLRPRSIPDILQETLGDLAVVCQ